LLPIPKLHQRELSLTLFQYINRTANNKATSN
jgi:hypothetical protein